jgi:hypothetical protein
MGQQMVKQISVDLDHRSIVQLLRVYFSSKKLLPGVPMEVFISSSGIGFHLKFYKSVTVEEDLKIRALLWDDADRIVYALKKWALNQNEEYVDLCFDEKEKGKETAVPLEEILNRDYRKEAEKISNLINNGDNDAADKEVKNLAKEIKPKIEPFKKPQWVGCIGFNGDNLRQAIEKVCTDITEKDQTFKYKVYSSFYPEHEWVLVLFDTDKDQLWKRLTWLKNKTVLKDQNTPLWVKQRIAT